MADMNLYLVVAITVLAGIGIALLFFGALICIASAFGNKRMVWGGLCILLLPLTLLYVVLFWNETQYARRYLLPGAAMVIVAVGCVLVL